jgi:hypothetical protein
LKNTLKRPSKLQNHVTRFSDFYEGRHRSPLKSALLTKL